MAHNLNPSIWLTLYFASIVLISMVHSPGWLAGMLGLTLLAAGKQCGRLLRRTLSGMLAFNLSVSLGYLLLASWQGSLSGEYLLRVNLRVALMLMLGFLLITRVDMLAALRPLPLLRWLASLSIGQVKTFERILLDFRLAFLSRNLRHPRLLDTTRHAAAQAQTLLDKSLVAASETAQAMRSRGGFGD